MTSIGHPPRAAGSADAQSNDEGLEFLTEFSDAVVGWLWLWHHAARTSVVTHEAKGSARLTRNEHAGLSGSPMRGVAITAAAGARVTGPSTALPAILRRPSSSPRSTTEIES